MIKKHLNQLLIITASLLITVSTLPFHVFADAGQSLPAIETNEFKEPGMEYRPGVRWWWPGGAVEEDELIREINLLADNGFGYAEINPFGKDLDTRYGDNTPYDNFENNKYYQALEAVISEAAKRDLKIDLNMGSGWNANSSTIEINDSMGNMAIGKGESFTVTSEELDVTRTITIPEMTVSPSYQTDKLTSGGEVLLQGLVIAKIDSIVKKALTQGTFTGENEDQTLLDLSTIKIIDLSGTSNKVGDTVEWIPETEGEYAVISLFTLPTGARPIDSVNTNDGFVIDHMNQKVVFDYMQDWMGEGSIINDIKEKYPNTLRAFFNDSYEFYGDVFYNNKVYENAKDEKNILGYDLSPYLLTMYRTHNAWPHYLAGRIATNDSFYSIGDNGEKDLDITNRITYDYQLLVNELFLEGMETFYNVSEQHGSKYRQQAYNPPIDTIGAAKFIHIPEGEQLNENTLKRVSSGAHLYGRPEVTAEQFTLGNTPFKNTVETLKNGFDLQATAGINNFFYHGFNYQYFGDEATKSAHAYGENGYTPFFGIGVNVGEANSLWPHYSDINLYASRVNYIMQQGNPSVDVALYMPFNGTLDNDSGAGKILNESGYAWDAINDDAIQHLSNWDEINGEIKILGSNMTYKTIVVQDTTLPKETMEALQILAKDGAPIIFYGDSLPARHPGFANGEYTDYDEYVSLIAKEITSDVSSYSSSAWATSDDALVKAIGDKGEISYDKNANLRFIRRTLPDGGELAYFRNTDSTDNKVSVEVTSDYKNFYWLDQNTGNIYEADIQGNKIEMNLKGSSSIALLALPEGIAYPDSEISYGYPIVIDARNDLKKLTIPSIDGFSLTVTADNIGTFTKGVEVTKTYESDVLGNWKLDSFQKGELKFVNSPGIYKTNLNIQDISIYNGTSLFLDLGSVHTVAEVKINDNHAGKLMYSPYKIDISRYLQEGENSIEIKVTPRTYNRYIGFNKAYESTTGEEQTLYQYYSSINTDTDAYVDAGLIGPVSLKVYEGGEFDFGKEDPKLDVSQLEELIDSAKNISNENGIYTQDSFKALQVAIKHAEASLKSITSEELLSKEVSLLQGAIDGLKEVKVEDEKTDDIEDPKEDKSEPDPKEDNSEADPLPENEDNNGTPSKHEGESLPKTATNLFNLLFIGMIILTIGATVFFVSKRKRINKEQL